MLLTAVSYHLGAVALGNHDERTAILLELVSIWVHTVCRGRSHRTARHSLRGLGRTSIEHWVVLEVLWHTLAIVEACLDLSMSYITSHDDGAIEVYTGRDRVFAQLLANVSDRLVEVDIYCVAFTSLAQCLRYQLVWFVIHLLDEDTILSYLSLDVTVCRTRDTQSDRAGSTMTRQTNHANIVGESRTTKLCSETNLLSLLEQLLL